VSNGRCNDVGCFSRLFYCGIDRYGYRTFKSVTNRLATKYGIIVINLIRDYDPGYKIEKSIKTCKLF